MEDGTAGIVKDINMRHVVISTWDTQKLIIPNSRLNAMCIRNNSYQSKLRSAQFQFYVAYGSDVEKAVKVIRQAVMDSPYSVPGRERIRKGHRATEPPPVSIPGLLTALYHCL